MYKLLILLQGQGSYDPFTDAPERPFDNLNVIFWIFMAIFVLWTTFSRKNPKH